MSQQIGKYGLGEALGAGASGTVYKAVDTFSGQLVALKVLDTEQEADAATHRGLRRLFQLALPEQVKQMGADQNCGAVGGPPVFSPV